MRKITYLKTIFVAITLIVGSLSASAQEISLYSTGFESADGFSTSTTYSNVTPVIFGGAQSWSITMGTVTATSGAFITGTQGVQMRSYANNLVKGLLAMNFDLPYVTKVTFNAKAYDANIASFNAYYSTDNGVTWSTATNFTVATASAPYTYTISPSGAIRSVRIKIENQTNNVAGRLSIDDINIYGMTPASPLASAPTISLASGKYITQQSVTLTSTTPGATVYYTTDGTTPSNASSAYTSTFSVNSSMTVKAITYAPGYDASLFSIGIYTYPTNISTIALLKSADVSGFYKLTGEAVLTFQAAATSSKPKFIQDGTGGIMIFDSNSKMTTTYNLYDGITGLIGTLSPYNGMVEFVPFTDAGAKTSTANTLVPLVITLDQLINYPGQLVKVLGVTVSDLATAGTGKFVAVKDFPLSVGSLTANLTTYAAADQNFITANIPTVAQDITGVVLINLTAKLVPRSSADFVTTITNGLSTINENLNVSVLNGTISFTSEIGKTIGIYNAVGQKLLQRQTVAGLNTVQVSAKGVLLVKVDNRIAKVIL